MGGRCGSSSATAILRPTSIGARCCATAATLSQAMDSIRTALGVRVRLLPMSDDPVPTMLDTDEGRMHLQDYLVRRRCEPRLKGIAFDGAERARPAPGVIEAIEDADGIVISPSNPLISIGPILAVPGIREALRKRREDVVVVCPLVGGKSLKGPSDKMMAELGHEVSAAGRREALSRYLRHVRDRRDGRSGRAAPSRRWA